MGELTQSKEGPLFIYERLSDRELLIGAQARKKILKQTVIWLSSKDKLILAMIQAEKANNNFMWSYYFCP